MIKREPVNICHGWGCTLVTKCAVSDFNYELNPATWTRHFTPPVTGENCEHFRPLKVTPPKPGWGCGSEPND